MANSEQPDHPGSAADPAAQSRSRDRFTPPRGTEAGSGDGADANTLARLDATLTLVSAWLGNFQTLVRLELSRTVMAGKRIIALNLLLLPLALALVLSLCGGAGLIGYRMSASIYIGFAVFVLAQVLVLTAVLLYMRRLRAMLGFDETRRQAQQAKEALSDVFESLK